MDHTNSMVMCAICNATFLTSAANEAHLKYGAHACVVCPAVSASVCSANCHAAAHVAALLAATVERCTKCSELATAARENEERILTTTRVPSAATAVTDAERAHPTQIPTAAAQAAATITANISQKADGLEEAPFKCSACGAQFYKRSTYLLHVRTESTDVCERRGHTRGMAASLVVEAGTGGVATMEEKGSDTENTCTTTSGAAKKSILKVTQDSGEKKRHSQRKKRVYVETGKNTVVTIRDSKKKRFRSSPDYTSTTAITNARSATSCAPVAAAANAATTSRRSNEVDAFATESAPKATQRVRIEDATQAAAKGAQIPSAAAEKKTVNFLEAVIKAYEPFSPCTDPSSAPLHAVSLKEDDSITTRKPKAADRTAFECTVCHKSFYGPGQLTMHRRMRHPS